MPKQFVVAAEGGDDCIEYPKSMSGPCCHFNRVCVKGIDHPLILHCCSTFRDKLSVLIVAIVVVVSHKSVTLLIGIDLTQCRPGRRCPVNILNYHSERKHSSNLEGAKEASEGIITPSSPLI